MTTLTRQDAYNAANWQNCTNEASVECFFHEEDKVFRAYIPGDTLSKVKKPEDLEPLIKEAVASARPFEVLVPIEGSFMHMCYQRPPVWEMVLKNFRINVDTTLFTFGDTIYNPSGITVPEDYVHHEELHAEQQGHNPEGAGRWWARYFQDPYFRIDQEARAYAHQYDWWCKNGPKKVRNSREERFKKLRWLAQTLAGPTYGHVVNVEGATRLIKSFSKVK